MSADKYPRVFLPQEGGSNKFFGLKICTLCIFWVKRSVMYFVISGSEKYWYSSDSPQLSLIVLLIILIRDVQVGAGFISLPQLTPAPFRDREMTGDESVCTRPFFPVSFKCSQPAFVLGIKFPLSIVNAVSYTGPESNKFHTSHYISLVISFVKRGLNNKPGKPH